MDNNSPFLSTKGDYKTLIAYQKAECVYDVTYHFAHHFLELGDRTIDQMIQAARSGKQNIVEGNAASATSIESELKLYNVARASLKELLTDYEDFLRVRGLEQWTLEDERHKKTRQICKEHNNSAYYRSAIKVRSSETIANIAIILIHQTDKLLSLLFESRKQHFLQNGGIKEQMHSARVNARKDIQ